MGTLQDGEPNNCWLTTIATLPAQSSGFARLVPVIRTPFASWQTPARRWIAPARRVWGRLYLTFQPVKDQFVILLECAEALFDGSLRALCGPGGRPDQPGREGQLHLPPPGPGGPCGPGAGVHAANAIIAMASRNGHQLSHQGSPWAPDCDQ